MNTANTFAIRLFGQSEALFLFLQVILFIYNLLKSLDFVKKHLIGNIHFIKSKDKYSDSLLLFLEVTKWFSLSSTDEWRETSSVVLQEVRTFLKKNGFLKVF